MKELGYWIVKWGRITMDSFYLGASSFDEAVEITVEFMRKQQPKWDAGKDDILEIKRVGSLIVKGDCK